MIENIKSFWWIVGEINLITIWYILTWTKYKKKIKLLLEVQKFFNNSDVKPSPTPPLSLRLDIDWLAPKKIAEDRMVCHLITFLSWIVCKHLIFLVIKAISIKSDKFVRFDCYDQWILDGYLYFAIWPMIAYQFFSSCYKHGTTQTKQILEILC